jgi:AraC-like DNA-binding protein
MYAHRVHKRTMQESIGSVRIGISGEGDDMASFSRKWHKQVVAEYVGTAPPLEIIAPHPQHSFRSLTHDYPSEICGWHFHPEYEIHLVTQTSGSMIVGDSIATFEPGHISIIGPNLPHDWVSDLAPGQIVRDRDAVIQFSDEWIHECMELIPEVADVEHVLEASKRGLALTGNAAEEAADVMQAAVRAKGSGQVALFFELLSIFARADSADRMLLAEGWLDPGSDENTQLAVDAALSYIFENLTGTIRLSTAASLSYMSEATFSRYFKRAAGMTFSDMVKKLRIAHACRLLESTDDTIAHVAAASGYNNLANFNRQFLAEVGMRPSEYRQLDFAQKPMSPVLSQGLRATEELVAARSS